MEEMVPGSLPIKPSVYLFLAGFLGGLKSTDSVLWKCELVLLCILQTW